MADGTQTKTEFDDVRHGYAPPREHNRAAPKPHPATKREEADEEAPSEDASASATDAPEQFFEQSEETPQPADSLTHSVQALIDSGKTAYQAEIVLLKARVDLIASSMRNGIVFMAIALSAGMVTLLALGFGSIIILSGYMSNEAAVTIVVLLLATLTAITAWKAKEQFDRILGMVAERPDE